MAKGIPRPGGRTRRLFTQRTAFQVGLALCGLASGAAGNYNSSVDKSDRLSVAWPIICIAFLCLFALARIGTHWWETESKQTPHDLEGCLHALHAILSIPSEEKDKIEPRLRITIHVPTEDGQELEQVLEYVGDQRKKGTAGQKFSVRSGIIGRVFREKEPCLIAQRKNPDHAQYVDELVKEW